MLGRAFLTTALFSSTLAASSFILWFLLGALVNSDSFLPYAAMFGSVTFVIFFLWNNFVTSRVRMRKRQHQLGIIQRGFAM